LLLHAYFLLSHKKKIGKIGRFNTTWWRLKERQTNACGGYSMVDGGWLTTMVDGGYGRFYHHDFMAKPQTIWWMVGSDMVDGYGGW